MEESQYYRIGGLTIQFQSDLPVGPETFDRRFEKFKTDDTGGDLICIHHHIGLPVTNYSDLGKRVYDKPPWSIFKNENSWIYLLSQSRELNNDPDRLAIFNDDYTVGHFYYGDRRALEAQHRPSLTFFPTDQILIAQLMARRQGVYLHSAAVNMDGAGLVFVGHSSAGKSTTIRLLKDHGEVLCDDRNIVRQESDGFHVYGTWSHGEIPEVSSTSVPIKAILFLKKADDNRLVPMADQWDIRLRLLACLIKPLMTEEWWDKSLDVIEQIVREVPCYEMWFDKSGAIVPELEKLVKGG